MRVMLSVLLCFGLTFSSISSKAEAAPVFYSDKVAVLVYHHVDDKDTSSVTITTSLFTKQLAYLADHGYHFITMQQLREFFAGKPVPPNAVLVTFDDGYKSFSTNAYPVLKQFNVPAVNFIITAFLDQPQKSYVPALSRDEMRAMLNDGLIEFQCHSHDLHEKTDKRASLLTARLVQNGRTETFEEYEQRINLDMTLCKSEISRLSMNPDTYAYPFGLYNGVVLKLLERNGFRYAFTTKGGLAGRKTPPLEIPRVNAGSPFITPKKLHKKILECINGPS